MSDLTYAPERSPGSRPTELPGRPLRRRTTLPTGRAVVGGFLIASAALGIFVAYSRAVQGPTTSYVVARHDIALGTRLTAADLELLPMDLPRVVVDNAVFNRVKALEGATVVAPVRRGELVQAGAVVNKQSGPTEVEVSFAIEAARAVAGTLSPGETVDVLATFGGGADSYTVAIVRQAKVIETSRSRSALADSRTETVTLALASDDDALAVTHAVTAGEVTLVRSTGTAGGPAGQTYRAPAAATAVDGPVPGDGG